MKPQAWFTLDRLVLAITLLFLGIGIGAYAEPLFILPMQHDIREFNNTYHFINPLLACSSDEDIGDGEAKSLEKVMSASVKAHKDSGDVSDISVYYRDMNGPWVGINFDDPFIPGSLLKVPLAMSIYKNAEMDPTILNQELDYTGHEVDDPQFFKPNPFPNGKHTITELVKQMLTNSDNDAANVLANSVGATDFQATYDHLGVAKPQVDSGDYSTTARDYTSFFRILYNATYLDEPSSEKVLQILSETTFKDGLVAGVPDDIVVSHKFGERAFADSATIQLHDCGIVYVPKHPYLLCIMTRGTSSFPKLAETIADLSRLAYNYTVAQK